MPCEAKTFSCHVRKSYIETSGNPYYRGELCMSCMFWEDGPEDLDFKARVGLIDSSHGEGKTDTPEWF